MQKQSGGANVRILGHPVQSSVHEQRIEKGYAKEDEALLVDLGFLKVTYESGQNSKTGKKTKKKILVPAITKSNGAPYEATEIRDLFEYALDPTRPKYPMPELMRRLLEDKRCKLREAMHSMGTSPATRSYEGQLVAEINAMLRRNMDMGGAPFQCPDEAEAATKGAEEVKEIKAILQEVQEGQQLAQQLRDANERIATLETELALEKAKVPVNKKKVSERVLELQKLQQNAEERAKQLDALLKLVTDKKEALEEQVTQMAAKSAEEKQEKAEAEAKVAELNTKIRALQEELKEKPAVTTALQAAPVVEQPTAPTAPTAPTETTPAETALPEVQASETAQTAQTAPTVPTVPTPTAAPALKTAVSEVHAPTAPAIETTVSEVQELQEPAPAIETTVSEVKELQADAPTPTPTTTPTLQLTSDNIVTIPPSESASVPTPKSASVPFAEMKLPTSTTLANSKPHVPTTPAPVLTELQRRNTPLVNMNVVRTNPPPNARNGILNAVTPHHKLNPLTINVKPTQSNSTRTYSFGRGGPSISHQRRDNTTSFRQPDAPLVTQTTAQAVTKPVAQPVAHAQPTAQAVTKPTGDGLTFNNLILDNTVENKKRITTNMGAVTTPVRRRTYAAPNQEHFPTILQNSTPKPPTKPPIKAYNKTLRNTAKTVANRLELTPDDIKTGAFQFIQNNKRTTTMYGLEQIKQSEFDEIADALFKPVSDNDNDNNLNEFVIRTWVKQVKNTIPSIQTLVVGIPNENNVFRNEYNDEKVSIDKLVNDTKAIFKDWARRAKYSILKKTRKRRRR